MALKTIEEFEEVLFGDMEKVFGNCARFEGILRSFPEHLGVSDTTVLCEAAFETGIGPDPAFPVLHFHVTLAQKIPESFVPGVVMGLNDLNTAISAGGFPAFGCFGYYPPLKQIYLSYRIPINEKALDEELVNVRIYLGSLRDQLDLFSDYILFLCESPDTITLEAYMDYLDSVSDRNELKKFLEELEKEREEREEAEQEVKEQKVTGEKGKSKKEKQNGRTKGTGKSSV